MRRVVLDTNVLVSRLLVPAGLPAQIFAAWRALRFQLIISPAILQEVRQTLAYEHIRRKYAIGDAAVEQLLELLERDAILVTGRADVAGAVPDDRDDEQILACAVVGRADVVVSGDRHLLQLGEYRGMSILSPREFLALLSS